MPVKPPPPHPSAWVDAVVTLHPPARRRGAPSVQQRVQAVLDAVQASTGSAPADWVVFDGLDAFSLRAPAGFVEALSRRAEVAQVMPDGSAGSAMIEPVAKGPLMDSPDEPAGKA